ncbi:MAG: hypothetical protein GXP62_20385 [Oligoflexia bacterium]|nr:hypothetical protein [Oligoflexia bacterium]
MRLSLLLLLLLLLLATLGAGCSVAPDGDAHLYIAALSQASSYEQARDLCRRIRQPTSRGDCGVAVEEAWDRLDPDECHDLAQGPPELALWRDECMFQLAERRRRAGDLDGALTACVDTRFSRRCAWHLIQDEAEASLDETPSTAELRLARFVKVRRLPDAPLQFWLIRFRTALAKGTVLDEGVCQGLASPSPCYQALDRATRVVLDAWLRVRPERACAVDGPGSGAGGAGISASWTPGPRINAFIGQWQNERCGVGAPPPRPGR